MRKIILTGAALTLMCGAAFAQTSTGPAAQGDNVNKPGMTNSTTDKGSMEKGATGMKKDGMSKDGVTKEGHDDKSKDGAPATDPTKNK